MTLTRKQFHGIRNSMTAAEKDLVAYYDLRWQLQSEVPTIDEVINHLRKKHPQISHVSVNYYLTRWPVQRALEKRGINYKQHTIDELTQQQISAATVACNFADDRPLDVKLDEMGVLPTTYQAWLLDPRFKHLVDTISERNLKNIKPTAITEYTRLIAQGNWNAIKYYFDVTAAAQANETPQTEQLLRAIIEILQVHIKDGPLLDAIGKDILKAARNRTMEITSYVVEEEEVLDARRKLGI